jgi:hypothetical protein
MAHLTSTWRSLSPDQVYRTDIRSVASIGASGGACTKSCSPCHGLAALWLAALRSAGEDVDLGAETPSYDSGGLVGHRPLRWSALECSADDQCASDHCAWGGRCEPGLLELIVSGFDREARTPPPPAPASTPIVQVRHPPACAGRDEEQYGATTHCHWTALCTDGPGSPELPDAGVFSCMREYTATRVCPESCTFLGSCW